jgi:hypothetical protein
MNYRYIPKIKLPSYSLKEFPSFPILSYEYHSSFCSITHDLADNVPAIYG